MNGRWVHMSDVADGFADGSDNYGASLICHDNFFAIGAPQSGVTFSNGGAVHIYNI